MAIGWKAEGDLFEGCSCNLLCPCHVSFRQPATNDFCDTIWAVSFDNGTYGDVDLTGMKVAIFFHCPGALMVDGDWTTVLFVDDQASSEQEEALRIIFSGKAGGPWEIISQFYRGREFESVEKMPLEMTLDGRTRTMRATDRLFLEFQTVRGADKEGVVTIKNLRNVIHGDEHVMGLSNSQVNDETMTWEYQSKHGLYSKFNWSGTYTPKE